MRTEVPFVPRTVAILAEPLGDVQPDGDRQAVVLSGQFDKRFAGRGLHVRGVDDRQPTQGQALGGDVVQESKGFSRLRHFRGRVQPFFDNPHPTRTGKGWRLSRSFALPFSTCC